MSKIFKVPDLQNKPSRSGFDLGFKNSFSAKVGELLPIGHRTLMVGDKIKLQIQHRTVTLPLESSAFTRFTEYFDFFFVPYDQLYRQTPQILTQMQQNPQYAQSPSSPAPVGTALPWFEIRDFIRPVLSSQTDAERPFLYHLHSSSTSPLPTEYNLNYQGFGLGYEALKLWNYLGGTYTPESFFTAIDDSSFKAPTNRPCSALPFAAYQKIYFDYYRFQQWENNAPQCYNFDYLSADAKITRAMLQQMDVQSNLFTLRHCNYPKDLFFGILPSSQFGETAAVNIQFNPDNSGVSSNDRFSATVQSGSGGMANIQTQLDGASAGSPVAGDLQFDILQLRQKKALQRYREVIGTGNQDYKSMVKKIFGEDVPEYTAHTVRYLGGFRSNIEISTVVNNALGSETAEPTMKGIGQGTDEQNHPIKFTAKEPGIVMCIYRVMPLLDYALDAPHFDLMKTEVDDFANPFFDRLGLQELPLMYLDDRNYANSLGDDFLGYVPRYFDYKTSIDVVNGFFRTNMRHWVSVYDHDFFMKFFTPDPSLSMGGQVQINKDFFKVNAHLCDDIFFQEVNQSVDTDQFAINCNISFDAVRNLDYKGLPTNN